MPNGKEFPPLFDFTREGTVSVVSCLGKERMLICGDNAT
jgi:hypothetical protein